MKRALLNSLVVIALSAATTSPALAMHHRFSATSNALPLLETIPVRGVVTGIEGRQVQIKQSNGDVQTYTIGKSRQHNHELEVGTEVILGIRRLNDAVITIDTL